MSDSVCCERPEFVQSRAVVVHHEAVSSRYFLLRMECDAIARRAAPGQFIMLACAPDEEGCYDPLLPRPMAILDARGSEIEVLYFVVGSGTQTLRRTAESSLHLPLERRPMLRIIGPLGRQFTPIPNVDAHLALGGGSGVAPLIFFFRRYASGGAHWHLVLAARSVDQLARSDVVTTPGVMHLATDDGSAGFKGTAVDALKSLLSGPLAGLKDARIGIYAAGPEAMMRAAAKTARARGFPARVSLEGRMACGLGVCRACVVDGVTPHPKTTLLRRTVCQDGPVFDIDVLTGW